MNKDKLFYFCLYMIYDKMYYMYIIFCDSKIVRRGNICFRYEENKDDLFY